MTYRWIITKDRIDDGRAVGVTGPRGADPSITENAARFSLWDDDKICYYEGMLYGDYEGFEPLDDFGMPYAGCVHMKLDGDWL